MLLGFLLSSSPPLDVGCDFADRCAGVLVLDGAVVGGVLLVGVADVDFVGHGVQ